MFFELSKLLTFFLVPSNIMVSLGLVGIALLAIGYARAGRWMLVASILLIAVVGVLPIGNGLALPLREDSRPGTQSTDRHRDRRCWWGSDQI